MLNFCKYIDKNGGDLQKIISKSEHAEEIFKISSLNGLNKAEKNKKIISLVEKFDKSNADEIIKKLMKAVGKAKSNKITTFARGLTSDTRIVNNILYITISAWLVYSAFNI